MEITPETRIHALLENYPKLESFLMKLNPKYKKLKNPVLRRTVARIATLSQVAKIGGYEPLELVNLLRQELGQEPLKAPQTKAQTEPTQARPDWARQAPALTLDGNALLHAEKNPLAEVRKALKELPESSVILLTTDFYPAPMIETFEQEGLRVWSKEEEKGIFKTYIGK
ncbi:DUF1858 domain-containing protein [Nitratifractor sp.]